MALPTQGKVHAIAVYACGEEQSFVAIGKEHTASAYSVSSDLHAVARSTESSVPINGYSSDLHVVARSTDSSVPMNAFARVVLSSVAGIEFPAVGYAVQSVSCSVIPNILRQIDIKAHGQMAVQSSLAWLASRSLMASAESLNSHSQRIDALRVSSAQAQSRELLQAVPTLVVRIEGYAPERGTAFASASIQNTVMASAQCMVLGAKGSARSRVMQGSIHSSEHIRASAEKDSSLRIYSATRVQAQSNLRNSVHVVIVSAQVKSAGAVAVRRQGKVAAHSRQQSHLSLRTKNVATITARAVSREYFATVVLRSGVFKNSLSSKAKVITLMGSTELQGHQLRAVLLGNDQGFLTVNFEDPTLRAILTEPTELTQRM